MSRLPDFTFFREGLLPTLEEALKDMREALKELCRIHGIEDLSSLRYHTIATGRTEIRKRDKVYPRIQLKGVLENRKTKTIASWREEEIPADLSKLVNLYRACKHLSKACDYLYGV